MYPLVAGHEITGRAIRVGQKVTSIKPGDLVGVVGLCEGEGNAMEGGGVKAAEAAGWRERYNLVVRGGGFQRGNEQYCRGGGRDVSRNYSNYARLHLTLWHFY